MRCDSHLVHSWIVVLGVCLSRLAAQCATVPGACAMVNILPSWFPNAGPHSVSSTWHTGTHWRRNVSSSDHHLVIILQAPTAIVPPPACCSNSLCMRLWLALLGSTGGTSSVVLCDGAPCALCRQWSEVVSWDTSAETISEHPSCARQRLFSLLAPPSLLHGTRETLESTPPG